MKIAVIDDGIDKKIAENGLHINYHDYDVNQIAGNGIRHGTKVVGTVEKYCSDAKEYEIYDVMNTKESSSSMAVINALEELLSHKVDVVLMCLVVKNRNAFEKIKELCHELREKGSILIASASNSGDYSFPAVLDDVIGVGRMADCQSAVCWNGKDSIQLLGDVTPEFIKFGKIKRTIFSGTSKAAARVAALFLEQCGKGMKFSEHMISTWKENLPCDTGNILEQIEKREYKVKLQNEQMYEKIAGILKQMGYDLKDVGSDCYFDRIVRNAEEFAWLIPEILNRLDVSVVLERMHYFDFMSVYALANYLEKYT